MKKWIAKNTSKKIVAEVEFETMRELFNKIEEKFVPFEHLVSFLQIDESDYSDYDKYLEKVDEELNNLNDEELRLLIFTSTSEAYYQEFIEN